MPGVGRCGSSEGTTMKICIATSTFPSNPQDGHSAAGFFVRDFAVALRDAGCDVHVFTQESDACPVSDPSGLVVQRFRWWRSRKRPSTLKPTRPGDLPSIVTLVMGGATGLARLARRERFDCILAMWAVPAGLWALSASMVSGTPYAVWALGSDIWDYGNKAVFRPLLKMVLRRSVKNYADGRGLADQVAAMSQTPCAFLPSSRRLRADKPKERKKSDVTRFLFVGRWHANKGPDVLLKAMALLHRDGMPAHLDVYGGGPLEKTLRGLVARYRLSPAAVTLHGYIGPEAAAEVIASADCVVIPSRIDSIPVVLSDAVSLGKPVIATNVGDTGGLVESYGCGLTCPAEDPAALAAAMREFAQEDPASFRDGIEKVAELFDIDRAAATFLSDLRELAVGSSAPTPD